MQKIDTLKRRVSQLDDQLSRQLVDVETLRNRLYTTSGEDYTQVAEDLAVALMKVDIMQESLDKARSDIEAEEAVVHSPEYVDAVKRMVDIRKDVTKLEDTISKTYETLRSQLDKASRLCKDYDRLSSRYHGTYNTWLMSSYRWLSYLHRSTQDVPLR